MAIVSFVAGGLAVYGCKTPESIMLPSGEEIRLGTVEQVSRQSPLKYFQYEGFRGTSNDPFLEGFLVILEDDYASSSVGTRVLSEDEIAGLRSKTIAGVRFEVTDQELTFDLLRNYLVAKYPGSGMREVDPTDKGVDREVLVYDSKNGRFILSIQHVESGVPRSFVSLPRKFAF